MDRLHDNFPNQLDTLFVAFPSQASKDRIGQIASELEIPASGLAEDFSGKAGEIITLYPQRATPAKRIVLLGLGDDPKPHQLEMAIREWVHTRGNRKTGLAAIDLLRWSPLAQHVNIPQWAAAALYGWKLGSYDNALLKSEKGDRKEVGKLQIITNAVHNTQVHGATHDAERIVEVQARIMDLVNKPGSHVHAQYLAEWAVASGKENGFEVDIFDKKRLEKEGFGALLGVNQGSERPPVFILMQYKHAAAKQTIGLVGKGVTFDTGGISIKGSRNMHLMKSDMGGAAAVLGTIEAAAKLKLPVNIVAAVPATDNMPDGNAINPGDVLTSYSGKTIEVIDTDAEGRLILADGLSYVEKNFKPDVLIDFATLTGAAVISLGYHAGALFTPNDALASALYDAGQRSRERVWRMPIWEEYASMMDTDIADIKNYGGPPAGAITAATFLQTFTNKHSAWAHMDIAGMALQQGAFGKDRMATGFGLRLMINYLQNLS
ncbi:MAG: leucyl aminopeptidase [Bacteroidia bacterium]